MKLQVLQDGQGKDTGVFIPMEDWALIKNQYPDIENTHTDLATWEKDLIDARLDEIDQHPECLKPGENLLKVLRQM